MKRIAIVGSGISGLVSAYLLSERYDVTLFEGNDYLGGHTNTVDVELDGHPYSIDTGFIVFNKQTYPEFCKLLLKHNIPIQKSEMSFSYRSDMKKIEYNGHNLNTLFSDRRNIVRPHFYYFIKEILRFNHDAKRFLTHSFNLDISMDHFIKWHRYSKHFVECYLTPMIAAIWSKQKQAVMNCSARFILQFYANHGLLNSRYRPDWYVVANGSRSYIPYLIKNIKNQIHLNTKVEKIDRNEKSVMLRTRNGDYTFDSVLIATHSDQALDMLSTPSNEEQETLSAISYTTNEVVLHTDSSLMPKRKLAWASWNYIDSDNHMPTVTYYMNRLQSINSAHHFCVSINLTEQINKYNIIKKFQYSHPCFNRDSISAQAQHTLINGKNNTYYAGAYWRYGFHEDGVKSALNACEPLGVSL